MSGRAEGVDGNFRRAAAIFREFGFAFYLAVTQLEHAEWFESGAAGKDTRGMFGVHQFDKVEMFVFCAAEESREWHERLLAIEEELVGELGIPYRVVDIPVGDLGSSAARKFDIKAWFPRRSDTARSRRRRTRRTTRRGGSISECAARAAWSRCTR
jgi:hypothetical protein